MKNNTQRKLVCGMEIHAELKTNSKMFCSCKNDPFGAEKPNIYTCPTCLGLPGALPVANKKAIEWTIKVGLALGCKINLYSKFDRKNYFYPDLPKSYQISQYDLPFCYDGVVETSFGPVRIERIHLEEDTGKLIHKEINNQKVTLIDFNRSSVPLMEIVTKPDIKSPEQAREYGKKIREILRYLEVADCDMDQGGMRLEANISLAPIDQDELPSYKVEVKNINSFKFVEQAIKYEMKRQSKLLNENKTPIQETRGWNAKKSVTFSQRSKEDAQDYRYFPDPDLPPVRFTKKQIEDIRQSIPELPAQKIKRWKKEYGIEERYTKQLVVDVQRANNLEEIFKLAIQNKENAKLKLDANKIAGSIINKKIKLYSKQPQKVIDEFLQLSQTDNVNETEVVKAIQLIMKNNNDAVIKFRNGENKVMGFFIGQTLKQLRKKVDNKVLIKLITQELKK